MKHIIFQAKYLAWASPAHNLDLLSINSKWLTFSICINILCATYAHRRDLAPKLTKNLKDCVFLAWLLIWAIPANTFFHSLWIPLGHIFCLTKTLCACIALSPNLSLKTFLWKSCIFPLPGGNFDGPKPYNFRLKNFKVLLLTIIWIIYMKMSKIWLGHFLALSEIAWFSQKMSLNLN